LSEDKKSNISKKGTLTLKLKLNRNMSDIKKKIDIKSRKKIKKDLANSPREEKSLSARDVLKNISLKNQEIKERQKALRKASSKTLVKTKFLNKEVKKEEGEIKKETKKEEGVKVNKKIKKSEKKKELKEKKEEKEISEIDVFNTLKEIVKKEKAKKEIEKAKKRKEEEEKEEEEEKIFEKKKEKAKKKSVFEAGSFEKRRKKKNLHTYIVSEEDELNTKRLKKGIKSLRKRKIGVKTEHKKLTVEVELPEFITVSDLADRMHEKKAEVVKKLMLMGTMVTANQTIDVDTAELIIEEFGHKVKRVSESDVENVLELAEGKKFVSRPPVVTIMGHVDHGKTSLLDAIRSTNVFAGESGGITQHIGASRIKTKDGKYITFIDTPGHEAFTEMRIRGANITDIVVLVVAADDGVKEQTIEAINHAKAAKVPIIVAVNKIDKQGANPSRVKNELLNYEIVSEDLGGDIMFVEVSAKEKLNLDKLEEAILLQAELLELKAPIDVKANGSVIDAKMDPNKGVITSLLVQRGILKVGDLILAGTAYGKIKKMIDDKRRNQKEANPSMAVEVLGLNIVPKAGDQFYVISEEKEAREIIAYRERKERETKIARRQGKTLESMLSSIGETKKKVMNLIIKADVNGSIEAISGSLTKLNTDEVAINVIHSGTGAINESDVNLASISNALIIGFNVRANNNAKDLSKEKGVEIRYYSIIYNIIDEVKAILSGMLDPIIKEEKLGTADVRQVFKVSKVGTVAGCYITEGKIERNAKARLIRDAVVIFDGNIKALKRFKDDVKEVKQGYECGISIENYNDIKEKDVIECYKMIEEKRSL
jgi:translation initiation factor IF-2